MRTKFEERLTTVVERTITNLQDFNIKESERKPKTNLYRPFYQGPATNKLIMADLRKFNSKNEFGWCTLENGFTIKFKDSTQKTAVRISTLKLFMIGVIELARINNYKEKNLDKIKSVVEIPLIDYAKFLGKNVTIKETDDPEELKAEKKRVKDIIDSLRKRIKEDFKILSNLVLSWEDSYGKESIPDFREGEIIQDRAIYKGVIVMDFKKLFAKYLNHSYIIQIPMALFRLDERNELMFQLGYRLALHHGIKNNQKKKTNKRISVQSLLESVGSLRTIEDLKGTPDHSHWISRIKDPFENAMDNLQEIGVLKYWHYSNSDKTDLTLEQEEVATYSIFKSLYVTFEMI